MTITPRRPLPTTALLLAAPVGEAVGVVDGASVDDGGTTLVLIVVDGASVELGAAVVNSTEVVEDSFVGVGLALAEDDWVEDLDEVGVGVET